MKTCAIKHKKDNSYSENTPLRTNSELNKQAYDFDGRRDTKKNPCNYGSASLFDQNSMPIQPKLKINTPGDKYEIEADRIADQVVKMSNADSIKQYGGNGIQKKPLADGISSINISTAQRKCAQCEEEEESLVQRKESGGSKAMASQGLMSDLQTTRGKGQQMDTTTNASMSSRFGVDFSTVRIHNNTRAAQMSQNINAKAFTTGNDIYFNNGEYNPNTSNGKRLLAHELVHTVQQQSFSNIRRQFSYRNPSINKKDPIRLILNEKKLGKTYVTFNGISFKDNFSLNENARIILKALYPSSLSLSKTAKGFTTSAGSNYKIEVSANLETITSPRNKIWKGYYSGTKFHNKSKCKGSVPVKMINFSDLHNKVNKHEMEHWADIERISKIELKPLNVIIKNLSGTGVTKDKAKEDWVKKFDVKLPGIVIKVKKFINSLIAANLKYDGPKGSHHTKTMIKNHDRCARFSIRPR